MKSLAIFFILISLAFASPITIMIDGEKPFYATAYIMENISEPCNNNNPYLDGCALVKNNTIIVSKNSKIERVIAHELAHLWLWHNNKGLNHDALFKKTYFELVKCET